MQQRPMQKHSCTHRRRRRSDGTPSTRCRWLHPSPATTSAGLTSRPSKTPSGGNPLSVRRGIVGRSLVCAKQIPPNRLKPTRGDLDFTLAAPAQRRRWATDRTRRWKRETVSVSPIALRFERAVYRVSIDCVSPFRANLPGKNPGTATLK